MAYSLARRVLPDYGLVARVAARRPPERPPGSEAGADDDCRRSELADRARVCRGGSQRRPWAFDDRRWQVIHGIARARSRLNTELAIYASLAECALAFATHAGGWGVGW